MDKKIQISKELDKLLDEIEIMHANAILILQDEVKDRFGHIIIPEMAKRSEQAVTGTGIIVDMCAEKDKIDEEIQGLKIGDKIKFAAGTQVNAEYRDCPEFLRLQMIHKNNIIAKPRKIKRDKRMFEII